MLSSSSTVIALPILNIGKLDGVESLKQNSSILFQGKFKGLLMSEKLLLTPVVFSPAEFAALFKKSLAWSYRQLYSGRINAITEFGRIRIPASEVERILESSGRYLGKSVRPARSKAQILALKPKLESAWKGFLRARRGETLPNGVRSEQNERKAAMSRLTRAGKKSNA